MAVRTLYYVVFGGAVCLAVLWNGFKGGAHHSIRELARQGWIKVYTEQAIDFFIF